MIREKEKSRFTKEKRRDFIGKKSEGAKKIGVEASYPMGKRKTENGCEIRLIPPRIGRGGTE